MNQFSWRSGLLAVALVLTSWLSPAPAAENNPPPSDDVQDFVFLGEARPVLVRVHVRVDGKPVHAAWDDFMKYLFNYLDVNGDATLSKEEAERAPAVDQILGRNPGRIRIGGRGGNGPQTVSMSALDADKDGKVTPAELAAYYRNNGYVPFQFHVNAAAQNPVAGFAALGGGRRPDPSPQAVADALFNLLDANNDGNLTREELAAAPAVLLRLDEDEDEMVSARELVPNDPKGGGDMMAAFAMMAQPGKAKATTSHKALVMVATPGEAPADLVRRMRERYGPADVKADDKKLTRKDVGLDEANFAALDANKDGVLDSQELAAFVKRQPDLTLTVRLGKKEASETRLALGGGDGKTSPLDGNVRIHDNGATLDLGLTRVDVRAGNRNGDDDPTAPFARQALLAQFKQADKDNKGFLVEKDLGANAQLRKQFKVMDRDGDGKLYEKEVVAYLEKMREIQTRAREGCVSLVLSDQSRGLFDLLDVNGDGRLSVREMRQAVKLLDQLDRDHKGSFSRAGIPHGYQLTLRRGGEEGNAGGPGAFLALYQTPNSSESAGPATGGPLWFRKMDRNRDGDVSRKEFLGSDEEFRKLDLDGDGLISREEAEKADALYRREKRPNP